MKKYIIYYNILYYNILKYITIYYNCIIRLRPTILRTTLHYYTKNNNYIKSTLYKRSNRKGRKCILSKT